MSKKSKPEALLQMKLEAFFGKVAELDEMDDPKVSFTKLETSVNGLTKLTKANWLPFRCDLCNSTSSSLLEFNLHRRDQHDLPWCGKSECDCVPNESRSTDEEEDPKSCSGPPYFIFKTAADKPKSNPTAWNFLQYYGRHSKDGYEDLTLGELLKKCAYLVYPKQEAGYIARIRKQHAMVPESDEVSSERSKSKRKKSTGTSGKKIRKSVSPQDDAKSPPHEIGSPEQKESPKTAKKSTKSLSTAAINVGRRGRKSSMIFSDDDQPNDPVQAKDSSEETQHLESTDRPDSPKEGHKKSDFVATAASSASVAGASLSPKRVSSKPHKSSTISEDNLQQTRDNGTGIGEKSTGSTSPMKLRSRKVFISEEGGSAEGPTQKTVAAKSPAPRDEEKPRTRDGSSKSKDKDTEKEKENEQKPKEKAPKKPTKEPVVPVVQEKRKRGRPPKVKRGVKKVEPALTTIQPESVIEETAVTNNQSENRVAQRAENTTGAPMKLEEHMEQTVMSPAKIEELEGFLNGTGKSSMDPEIDRPQASQISQIITEEQLVPSEVKLEAPTGFSPSRPELMELGLVKEPESKPRTPSGSQPDLFATSSAPFFITRVDPSRHSENTSLHAVSPALSKRSVTHVATPEAAATLTHNSEGEQVQGSEKVPHLKEEADKPKPNSSRSGQTNNKDGEKTRKRPLTRGKSVRVKGKVPFGDDSDAEEASTLTESFSKGDKVKVFGISTSMSQGLADMSLKIKVEHSDYTKELENLKITSDLGQPKEPSVGADEETNHADGGRSSSGRKPTVPDRGGKFPNGKKKTSKFHQEKQKGDSSSVNVETLAVALAPFGVSASSISQSTKDGSSTLSKHSVINISEGNPPPKVFNKQGPLSSTLPFLGKRIEDLDESDMEEWNLVTPDAATVKLPISYLVTEEDEAFERLKAKYISAKKRRVEFNEDQMENTLRLGYYHLRCNGSTQTVRFSKLTEYLEHIDYHLRQVVAEAKINPNHEFSCVVCGKCFYLKEAYFHHLARCHEYPVL